MPERAERGPHQGAGGERRREKPARRAARHRPDRAERPDRQQDEESKRRCPRANSASATVSAFAPSNALQRTARIVASGLVSGQTNLE